MNNPFLGQPSTKQKEIAPFTGPAIANPNPEQGDSSVTRGSIIGFQKDPRQVIQEVIRTEDPEVRASLVSEAIGMPPEQK